METAGAGAPTSMDALDAKLDAFLPPPAATTAAPPPAPPPARSAWLKATDPASGAPYWYNEETGESSWTPPPGAPVPPPAGPPPTQVWDFVCRHSLILRRLASAHKSNPCLQAHAHARARTCTHAHTHAARTHASSLARSRTRSDAGTHEQAVGPSKQIADRMEMQPGKRVVPQPGMTIPFYWQVSSLSLSPLLPRSLCTLSLSSLSLSHSLTHSYIHTHTHTHTRAGGHRVRHESSQFLPDGRGRGHSPHRWRHQIWRHQQSLARPRGQCLRCSGSSCISACTSGQTDRGAEGVCTRV